MNKKHFKILSILISASLLISCAPIHKGTKQNQSESTAYNNIDFSNKYIYVDNNNSLCLKDKYSENIIVLSENVLEFKNSDKYLVFINKDFNGKSLQLYNISTGKSETLKSYYNEDFLVKDDYLFYIEENSICKVNLNSNEKESLVELSTNDVVLNFVNDTMLIFSYIKNSVPTSFSYNLTNGDCKEIATNSTNVIVLNDTIYGLDSNFNIFKVKSDYTLDTVSNYPILKFTIDADYLTYMDTKGSLITLDSKGNKRIISDSVIDFKRIGDNLYYISASSENTIFETQLTGRHKKAIIKNSSPILNLNFIN